MKMKKYFLIKKIIKNNRKVKFKHQNNYSIIYVLIILI